MQTRNTSTGQVELRYWKNKYKKYTQSQGQNEKI